MTFILVFFNKVASMTHHCVLPGKRNPTQQNEFCLIQREKKKKSFLMSVIMFITCCET